MKKLRFKKWVEVSLLIINVLMIFIMGSEVEDTYLFVITHVGAGLVFLLNSYLLMRYTDAFEE